MKRKIYVITSATPGCRPSISFLESLTGYCKIKKAELLILPTAQVYKKDELAQELYAYGDILTGPKRLNSNIHISDLPINPEQSDPITGLDRLTHKEHSAIYASPKQRMKSIASPSSAYPRVIMTPGSCTAPYKKNSKRGLAAFKDHVMGAIIVEVVDDKFYHFRQVQADSRGGFNDLALYYKGNNRPVRAKVAAFIPGDYHVGSTDPEVQKCIYEMLALFKPERLFLHDFFDGISVNHHIEHKLLLKAMLGTQNDLTAELALCAQNLRELAPKVKKEIVIVKSNHDEFLDRWLVEGKYISDSRNHIMGLELALAKARGKDPLEAGIKKFGIPKNIKFLKDDDSFKITSKQIECGQHGHLGPNGSRGNATSIEKSYSEAVIGHIHSPEIQRGTWVVGTSSYLKLDYTKGPSSWMHSHCVVYANGSRQLLNVVNGSWRVK